MGARVCRPVSSTKAVTARVRSSCVTLAFGEGSEAKATIGDDGQVAVMAAQLYAQGAIDLLGFTVLSGNQWRDQEVSDCLKAVERLGIEHRVKVHAGAQYPLLDVTNTVTLLQGTYDQIVSRTPPTSITQLYKQSVRPGQCIYDTVALASFYNSSLDVETRDLYVDVSTTFDQNYGKLTVSTSNPYPSINLLSASKVVVRINNSQFFAFYTDLFTRSVPVQFIQDRNQDKD
jgi:inosine-uridine nucleoside N-ribohydrolase